MKMTRKITALLLAVLVLAVLLAGCSSKQCVWCGKTIQGAGHDTGAGYVCDDCYNSLSGVSSTASRSGSSNTGVWIAVIIMVFIAVFSATSGVVYLVLQKVLPPEKQTPRERHPQDYTYDDFEAPRPASRPVSNAAPRTSGGVWICPRDRNRNSGPYCTVCGAKRPAAPRPGNAAPQRSPAPGQNGYQAPAPRPQSPQAPTQQAARTRTAAYGTEESGSLDRQTPPVQRQQPAAPAYRNPEPMQQPSAPRQSAPPAQGEKPYRPRFARQEPAPEEELEVDSELLAAIFREAAKDPEE